MRNHDFSNLTKSQVEALLECFDFIANGYAEKSFIEVGGLWVVQMQHIRTSKVLRIFIHKDHYNIYTNRTLRKKVCCSSDTNRYRLVVNSDTSVGVVRLKARAYKM